MLGKNWNENHEHIYGKRKDEHKEQSSPFSKYLLNSVYQDNGEVEVYGKFLIDDNGNVNRMSIISTKMLDTDLQYFKEKEKKFELTKEEYHPYFSEFIIKTHKLNRKMLRKLVGVWIKVKIIFKNLEDKKYIKGKLLFSASPIERIDAIIDFNPSDFGLTEEESNKFKELKDIYVQLLLEYNQSIENCFERVTQGKYNYIDKICGKIYNVGQGNCINLNINDTLKIYFDVGESINPSAVANEEYYIKLNSKEISESVPNLIILSHWDLDHILGISYFNPSLYCKTLWIAPNISLIPEEKQCMSLIRLVMVLLKNKKIFLAGNKEDLSNRKRSGKCLLTVKKENFKFQIFQGAGKSSPNGFCNNIGLILSIELFRNDKQQDEENLKLLFTGDCEYRQMQEDIVKEKYDLIVTSHHGSKNAVWNYKLSQKKSENRELQCVNGKQQSKAVLSYGVNSYGHPDAEHITALKNNGFEILSTPGCRYIEFSVSYAEKLTISAYPNRN